MFIERQITGDFVVQAQNNRRDWLSDRKGKINIHNHNKPVRVLYLHVTGSSSNLFLTLIATLLLVVELIVGPENFT